MGAIIDVFLDLTAINSPITGGDLLLELENFTSLNKSEYFTVYDVTAANTKLLLSYLASSYLRI